MSGIPRPGSRLPAPTPSGAAKRPRIGSTADPAAPAQEAKKKRLGAPSTSSSSLRTGGTTATRGRGSTLKKANSMLNIGPASRVTRPLASSYASGRTTMAPGARTASMNRSAAASSTATRPMKDRTNSGISRPGTAATTAGKQRPGWDMKGKMEDMDAKLATTLDRVTVLENLNNQLKSNVEEKETIVVQNSEELKTIKDERDRLAEQETKIKKELESIKDESEEKVKKLKRQLDDLEFEKSSLERKVRSLEDELSSQQEEIRGLKTTVSQVTSASAGIESELKVTKKNYGEATEKIAELTKLSSNQACKIELYEEKERAFETERRRLHNTIQELKGNIRVFCRVRPLLGEEIEMFKGEIRHIEVGDEKTMALVRSAESPNESVAGGLKGKNAKYDFEFDRVFKPETTQEQVFEEISQLVQSAIDGYNVCVFAYGQTGSGKTFTMEGGTQPGQEGMIPLTLEKIYEQTKALEDKGWSYKMEASFLEIYNEEIRDLLATEKNLKYDVKMTGTTSGSNLKAGQTNEVYVTNLKVEEVETTSQVAHLLKRAAKNRAVAATNCNERSSRSHSVFQLRITGKNSITTEVCSGMLNLVDLAGSERLKESGSEGLRLTETKNINKSLANLGNVIMALAQKDSHIPYRNSKLTHVLQNSLGGNSKTLMFVNINPREEYFAETLNSLRFATKVNQCQIGTASKKVKN